MVDIGSLDRTLGLLAGIALFAAPFLLAESFAPPGPWRLVVAAVGAVLLATAAFRMRPAYRLSGFHTSAIGRA